MNESLNRLKEDEKRRTTRFENRITTFVNDIGYMLNRVTTCLSCIEAIDDPKIKVEEIDDLLEQLQIVSSTVHLAGHEIKEVSHKLQMYKNGHRTTLKDS